MKKSTKSFLKIAATVGAAVGIKKYLTTSKENESAQQNRTIELLLNPSHLARENMGKIKEAGLLTNDAKIALKEILIIGYHLGKKDSLNHSDTPNDKLYEYVDRYLEKI